MRTSKYTVEEVRSALKKTTGNITRMALILTEQTTKTHAMRLVQKFGLSDYARKLRMKSGNAATGRPSVN